MKEIDIVKLVPKKAKKRGGHRIVFHKDRSLNQWQSITWSDFAKKVDAVANAMVSLGVDEEQNVGVIAQNMPHGLIVDFASYANRAVVVPMFATLSSSQISYIINDAQIKLVFVGEQLQYDAVLEALSDHTSLEHIVVFDDAVDLKGCSIAMRFSELYSISKPENTKIVEARTKRSSKDDLLCILYTSGTTGDSKGVMLSHENIAEAIQMLRARFSMKKGAKSIAFLPMSHIFERLWSYCCMASDVKVYLNGQPVEIQDTIKEVLPQYMCAVPRFWEKVYIGVKQKIEEMTPSKKAMVAWAMAVGQEYNIETVAKGKRANFFLWLRYKFAHKFVFSKLKKALGIQKAIMLPVAGAALSDKQARFFISIGIPICYGYGLTETSATVSCYPPNNFTIGSVGTIMSDIEVRIGDDSEIQIKGKTITKGYYNRPEENEKAFVDGWFRTGDIGRIEGETLYMTDRLKDMFKTSNGKYISPQAIETVITSDPYFEQIAVIGNNRNYVTAIISPSIPLLTEFVAKHNIQYQRIEEVFVNPLVIKLFEDKIALLQNDFASFEKIKKFRFIKKSFSIESGELTSTLKIKRSVVLQNYANLIDEMYEE